MKIIIEIKCNNAAFEVPTNINAVDIDEVEKVFSRLVFQFNRGTGLLVGSIYTAMDSNGNKVATLKVQA